MVASLSGCASNALVPLFLGRTGCPLLGSQWPAPARSAAAVPLNHLEERISAVRPADLGGPGSRLLARNRLSGGLSLVEGPVKRWLYYLGGNCEPGAFGTSAVRGAVAV